MPSICVPMKKGAMQTSAAHEKTCTYMRQCMLLIHGLKALR